MRCDSSLLSTLIHPLTAISQPNQTQTATPAVLNSLRLFSEFSATAYCSDNYLKPFNGSLVCPTTICPILPTTPAVQIADSFVKVSWAHTTGLILLDHVNQLIVASFQGTHTARDWLADLDFLMEDADDICQGCEAHSGFLDSWRGVRDIVINDWKNLTAKYPSYKTVATGHSLGGAIANLCAAQMKQISWSADVALYTYGSPRVGNDDFASYIEKAFGWDNHRVTHLNDPIPRLPPQWIGFVHPGPEYAINAPHIPDVLAASYSTLLTPANLIVNPSEVLVLPGPESKSGNDGYSCVNPAMHSEYIGRISGCLSSNLQTWDFWHGICGDFFLCCNDLTANEKVG